ncbi:MAG: hypothetical protein K2K89_02105, partial [Ruminococcus sp.]|nr:hypothetical protein [Ruminococcus sp.]
MSQDDKRITYELTEQELVVDSDTGEVKSEVKRHTQRIRVGKEPPYVKLYLDHLSRFKGLQLSLNPILAEMLKKTTYANPKEQDGGMILYLNKPLKADIAKMCGVGLHRVDNAVTEFVKKGYMRRLDLGKYQFNPFFFGKGEWKDIENIRATFDYGTGEAIAEIVKKEENAMNIASDEITNKSFEELTELQKKKRAEQLNCIPPELWTKTDYRI